MTNFALDRAISVQKLKDADCPPLLAEAIVDVVSINRTEVATKSDFESMKKDFIRLEDGIKQQQEKIIDLGGKVNDLNHEFQGLRKDFLSFDEKAELRWKAQQAESQVLVAKIEAIDTKLETKLEAFESKLETDDSNLDTKLAAFDSKLDSIIKSTRKNPLNHNKSIDYTVCTNPSFHYHSTDSHPFNYTYRKEHLMKLIGRNT